MHLAQNEMRGRKENMKRTAWKKILAGFLAVVCLTPGSLAAAGKAQAADTVQVSVDITGNRVTIGNEYISREFSVEDGKLSTVKITNKRTDGKETAFTPAEGSEEFKICTTKGEPAIDRSGWTAAADSYENAEGDSDGNALNLIDGRLNSIWHSNYDRGKGSQNFPYNVIFTLGKSTTFQSFSYTPRQESEDYNGNLKEYELYYSTSLSALTADSSEWKLLKKGSFSYNGVNPIYVNLDSPCTAAQLKLKAISANNGLAFGCGAEFNLHEHKVAAGREFAASALTLKGEPVVEPATATINHVEKTGQKVTFQFEPYTFKGVEYAINEVVVMYDGDHFTRKYMEISVSDGKKADAVIDYIDLESLKVNESDAVWTIPTDAGGIVQMNQFKANLGQPIYIQGMFFGCEFPAADNEIVNGTGYMRYYTGKSFERMELDQQLTQDGKYVTWQTVAGAARSTDKEVVQADFFEYIKSIATPSEFRIQYNSWFDNMMRIDDQNILDSFIEIDRELNQAGVRPLDSYVVDDGWVNYNDTYILDTERAGTTLNQSCFWEFNIKFPQGLTPSSELVHNFGSNFGVWVGPRGGYNFYGSLADILVKSGKGSKAGGSIDVADRTYVKNFSEMAVKWQKEYKVNYWKWDGFADTEQYSAFPAEDGVPGYANRHMTGGYENMYHVTDLWEAWIDLLETVRQSEREDGIKNLWISLTCYVNPSPWYLQWANSVWLQCTYDQSDAGYSSSKMDRQITYRDAAYYDFLKNHEFQFPLSNIYNHDPVYGTEETGMYKDTATDEQFKNYLYMLATRGTAFWELYFSDSIMTDGKYEAVGEFLAWAEENYHMLKNSKMFGESPNTGTTLGGSWNGEQNAYGYSCFDGTDGIMSLRNPASSAKTVTISFDRTLGVPENAGTLKYHIEHSHNLTAGTASSGEMTYGRSYTFTLQPDEVRILRISKDGDTAAPEFERVFSDGGNEITVKFNEKVNAGTFKINEIPAVSAEKSTDGITFRLTAEEGALTDGSRVLVTVEGLRDLAGNLMTENTTSFVYHKNNTVTEHTALITEPVVVAEAKNSLTGNNGFTVSAEIYTVSTGTVLKQGDAYAVGINEDGTAYFALNGTAAVSKTKVNDGMGHTVTGVKENNGILKIYIDGQLEGSGYRAENRYYEVEAADIVAGDDDFAGVVGIKAADAAIGYDVVKRQFGAEPEAQNWARNRAVAAKWVSDGRNAANASDYPLSMAVDGIKNTYNYGEFGADGNISSSYLEVDLGGVRSIAKIHLYRYWEDGRTYAGTVVALSKTVDFADKTIVYNSDADNFHGLGAGKDASYAESERGKSIVLKNPEEARYVRVYMHGRSSDATTNHVVELEVVGAADYASVDAAISAANALNKADYKDFSSVDAAIAAVVRGKDATEQTEVNAMTAAVFKALSELERAEPTVPVNPAEPELETLKEQLNVQLADAKQVKQENYTAENWKKLQNAIVQAKVVVNSGTKEELRTALEELKSAMANLRQPDENSVDGNGGNENGGNGSGEKKIVLEAPKVISAKSSYKGITVKWRKVQGAVSYTVKRNGKVIAVRKGTSFLDGNPKGGVVNRYEVSANGDGVKTVSSTAGSISTKKVPKATKKITVKAAKDSRAVTVKWKKVRGATGYVILRSTKKDSGYKRVAVIRKANSVSYTDKKVKKGKKYYYQIVTRNPKIYSPARTSKAVKVKK